MRVRDGFKASLWIFVLVGVLGFSTWDALSVSRHILEVTDLYGVTVDPPAIDARSRTGYESGMRSMVLPPSASDTSHWVMQTQSMIARGAWRIRHVDYDNAPDGRDVHWGAPFHWWLALIASIDHAMSGRPIGISVERATLWSGPVMLVMLLVPLGVLLRRKFSPKAAALAAIGAVATYPFYIDFLPGRADHHGIANICGMLTVLAILVGSTSGSGSGERDADLRARRVARRWFAVSGVTGGVGLWISAATQTPVLVGVGFGFLVASWLGRAVPQKLAWLRDRRLLAIWGATGAAVSVAAYAVEYFPAHLGMRLEVNHPLYALAWLGAGELLGVSARAFVSGPRALTRRDLTTGALATLALVALPLTIALSAAKTFTVADPFIWRLHSGYISEFQGLLPHLIAEGFNLGWAALCLPMLLLVPPLVALFRRSTSADTKALFALATLPALFATAMAWEQVRWMGLAFALSIPVIAIFFRAVETGFFAKRISAAVWLILFALCFAPGAVSAVRRTLVSGEFSQEDVRSLALRDVAHALRLRAGDDRVVVAGAPTSTTRLVAHGGVAGVGTLYWENAAGLKHVAELFASNSAEAAHQLVRKLGVTHIAFFSWDAFEIELARMFDGSSQRKPLPKDAFITGLLSSPIPCPWLRALPIKFPDHPALAGQTIRVWEVVEDQTPAEAAAAAANYYLEMGMAEQAQRVAAVLEKFPDDLDAEVMLAMLAVRRGDEAAFFALSERIVAKLGRAAESLSCGDRIHLAAVLAVGRRTALAREQLQLCVARLDERTVRHLTPGELSDVLTLCKALGVAFPDPALQQLAEKLVPPWKRK